MQKCYDCGGPGTILYVHQNSLYSFVKTHVPRPCNIRALRVETAGSHTLLSLWKYMFKKQILESYVKYLDLLKMEQDQNSLHVLEDIPSPPSPVIQEQVVKTLARSNTDQVQLQIL